jgi:methyl-accepting chemotaxis protein
LKIQLNSVQGKIAVATGGALIATAVSLLVVSIGSSVTTQSMVSSRVGELVRAETSAKLGYLAAAQAGAIQAKFDLALDAARTMAHTFSLAKSDAGVSLGRSQINAILRHVLVNNPEFNGTYSCWEPGALDGNDGGFLNTGNGNNLKTGRFTPYWTRSDTGSIAVQPLVEYDTMDKHPNGVLKGGWYIGPRDTGKESVLAPLPYIVQGKNVWLATLSVPIVANGKFMGVAGADYNLDFVQKLSEKTNQSLYGGKGKLIIVSDMGLVVADSAHPDLVGKPFTPEVGADNAAQLLTEIQSGKSKTWQDDAANSVNALAPIPLGRTGKPWSVLIMVPKDVILADANQLSSDIRGRSAFTIVLQILLGIGITFLATAYLWRVAGRISRPIRDAADMAETIEEGIFTKKIEHQSNDEVGKLAQALNSMCDSLREKAVLAEKISEGDLNVDVKLTSENDQLGRALKRMVDNLNNLVRDLQGGAGNIANNAIHMSSLSQDLSEGSAKSAESVTEISTAMTEISAQTKNNAINASRAKELSQTSHSSATVGSQHMNQMMQAMDEIRAAGDSINDIINTINEITTQTNLLALNAAIEAARAGESGRGFAVVADEVRTLAIRSASAAQQVAVLIESSSVKTRAGVDIANKTADSLQSILSSTEEVSSLVEEISNASEEQVIGINEISSGLHQIDSTTQHASRNAEECADAAKQLTEQSNHVHHVISQFRIRK